MSSSDSSRRLLGVETEYALTAHSDGGKVLPPEVAIEALMKVAKEKLVWLPGSGGPDLFLENGSRLYIDCGCHPELATPECTDPLEVVRYTLAGERTVTELAREASKHHRKLSRVEIYKSNVDYSGSGTTWGCHESYLYRSSLRALVDPLIPHLVSRVIFSGAGGFQPLSPGIEFTLSPRAAHLKQTVSGSSTHGRGIFHTKEESLSGLLYGRLHVLCGESLSSERAQWLKLGTTALVVALADAGVAPDGLELRTPVEAMHAFAADPHCRKKVRTASGLVSAVDIQAAYLELAESNLDAPFMPVWADALCREWRETLQLLRASPRFISTRLDWAIKRRFFGRWIRRRGFGWTKIAAWNEIINGLVRDAIHSNLDFRTLGASTILDPSGPLRSAVKDITPLARIRGCSWDDLDAFLKLRHELFELDVRFGDIGDQGLFHALEQSDSAPDTRVPGLGSVGEAQTRAPGGSRAHLRGGLVRRLSREPARYRCQWDSIWDLQSGQCVSLKDPFEVEERWESVPEPRMRRLRNA